jgi:hypothetical protein
VVPKSRVAIKINKKNRSNEGQQIKAEQGEYPAGGTSKTDRTQR